MENNSQEVWKQIDGFEDYYQVSSEGKVRSLDRLVRNGTGSVKLMKSKVLKPQMNKNGYLLVNLWKDSKQIHYLVHRLVYEAFNGQIPEGMQVNHIDENKSNNSLNNLNLMTPKQNVNWGTCIERRSKSQINHKKFSKAVVQYDLQGNFIAEYPSQREAERITSINHKTICNVLNGWCKTAGGYKWKYKE